MNELNSVLPSTLGLSQAVLTCVPSILCILFCLFILFQTKPRHLSYKASYFFIIIQILIIINCLCEVNIILGASKSNSEPTTFLHIYLFTFYSLAATFYVFCKHLDEKYHWMSLITSIMFVCLMVLLHKSGLLINGFRSNGFIYVSNTNHYFWLYELGCGILAILSISVLIKNSMHNMQAIRSHSVVTLFASAPIIMFLLITLLLMRNSDNYTTIIYAPAFFIWMNLAYTFTSHRAVVDLSMSKQHIRAYSLLVRSTESATSNKDRIKLIEQAWNMLATHTENNHVDAELNEREEAFKEI